MSLEYFQSFLEDILLGFCRKFDSQNSFGTSFSILEFLDFSYNCDCDQSVYYVRLWRQQRKPTVEHQENVNTTEPRSSLEDGTSEIVGQLADYLGLCDHYKEDPKLRSSPSREENQENSSPANRHQLPAGMVPILAVVYVFSFSIH